MLISKRWKVILMILLFGILILIFFIQRKYFIEELNGHLLLGTGFLLAVLTFEFLSHLAFWKAKDLSARLFFGCISLVLILFSVFVTFSVQIHHSEQRSLASLQVKYGIEQQNRSLILANNTLEEKKNRLKSLISDNKKLIGIHQKRKPWLAFSLIKKNEKLSKELSQTEKELVKSSKVELKATLNYSILENVERKTKLNAGLVSLFNKGFLAMLLSIIPFSICYLLTRNTAVAVPDEEKEENNDENEEESEPELVPADKKNMEKDLQVQVTSYPINSKPVYNKIFRNFML